MEVKNVPFAGIVLVVMALLCAGCAVPELPPTLTPTRTQAIPTATPEPTAAPPTPTPSPTSTPDPYPGWATYRNDAYGFAFRYPVAWGLAEVPASGEAPAGPAAATIRLMREGLQLGIQVQRQDESYVMGPSGRGAGEIVDHGTVSLLGYAIPKQALVYEGKAMSVFFRDDIDELTFYVQLDAELTPGMDYGDAELSENDQAEMDAILGSFVRTTGPGQPVTAETTGDAPNLGDTRTREVDGMEMVYVPAGEFVMGTDDDDVAYYVEMCETDWSAGRGRAQSSEGVLVVGIPAAHAERQP